MSINGSGFGKLQWLPVGTHGAWIVPNPILEEKRQRRERLRAQIKRAVKETLDAKERQQE